MQYSPNVGNFDSGDWGPPGSVFLLFDFMCDVEKSNSCVGFNTKFIARFRLKSTDILKFCIYERICSSSIIAGSKNVVLGLSTWVVYTVQNNTQYPYTCIDDQRLGSNKLRIQDSSLYQLSIIYHTATICISTRNRIALLLGIISPK